MKAKVTYMCLLSSVYTSDIADNISQIRSRYNRGNGAKNRRFGLYAL